MEFLKELFGTEALTYDQLAEKVTAKKMKLADLSAGAYVGKEKFEALSVEKEGLATRLAEANTKLEGYDPEWKAKAEQAQKDAEAKVAELERRQLLGQQAAALKFSSESARRAFVADLEAKGLPVQDGKLLGFDDFVKEYQAADPGAFASAAKPPVVVRPTDGGAPGPVTKEAFGKMGYRQRLALKREQPEIYEQLKE